MFYDNLDSWLAFSLVVVLELVSQTIESDLRFHWGRLNKLQEKVLHNMNGNIFVSKKLRDIQ